MIKTQELKNFNYFGISHKGNVRKENEDAFIKIETINGIFFILCDGMGGVKGGKEAAELTIKHIKNFVSKEWEAKPKKLISEAIKFANKLVYEYFQTKNPKIKPGTTIVLALVRENKIYYAHVGDSRIYYQTGKKLFPLTTDHSHVMNLVNQKIITKEEARTHIRRNEITKAIGIKQTVDADICNDFISPANDDILLLCSDGLTGELTDKEILNVLLKDNNTEEKVKKLIGKVLKREANDNVTVQIINFYNTGKETNTHFETKKKSKKNIQILFFFCLLLITGIILYFATKDYTKVNLFKSKSTKTSLLILKSNPKDTLINIFMFENKDANKLFQNFGLLNSEIGYSSGLIKKASFIKYYIPVKAVYIHKVGKFIKSYPDIYNKNSDDMINILIVNNKNELYFSPGEKIIIPKSINRKNSKKKT